MRAPVLLTCLVLVAATRQTALAVRPVEPQALASQIFELPLPVQGKIDERALYQALGTGGHKLEVDIRVNGRPYLAETLTLPADAAGATFELLSGDPGDRDRLFKLAENRSNRVRVVVKIDGRPVRDTALQELVSSSRDLQRLPMRLGRVTGGERSFFPEIVGDAKPNPLSGLAKSSCETACQSAFYSCMSSWCAGQEECDYCNGEFGSCIANCPPPTCTDPKSVSQHNSSTITNVQSGGLQCRLDWFYGGQYYDQYYLTIRTDHYTDTTYCDGHTTSSYYSTYSSGFCEHPTNWQCSYTNGYAYNICY